MESIKNFVRGIMTHIAGFIDYWSKGRIKPAHITALSLAGHIPIAWALVECRPVLAGVLLIIFGLMDALDGALARVQKSASLNGMFFDAVSDRIKEAIIYSALIVYVDKHIEASLAWQVVAVAVTSVLVSYVKAKGEMALAEQGVKNAQKLNREFSVGFASYEVRMTILVAALLFGFVEYAIPLLLALNLITIAERFLVISKRLYEIDKKPKAKKK